ncbi:MAG: putative Nucleoside diphosphate kinase [Candidatus Saccharibacteria bacterium]|nr:putative Nucleoside diphosphate kinase [Candidatus Saccharibacteria bacterium]
MEQTLVIIKPDAIARAIIGDIITRFERVGLRVVGAKFIKPDPDTANKHYPTERREFIDGMGQKTLDNYKQQAMDPVKELGTDDTHKIGLMVQKWLVEFLTSGPALVLVLEGPHAIELVRKIAGHTLPSQAQPGTIRGDYSFDSSALANASRRPIRNLVHASGNKQEAEFEINLWFKPVELIDYNNIHQQHMTD